MKSRRLAGLLIPLLLLAACAAPEAAAPETPARQLPSVDPLPAEELEALPAPAQSAAPEEVPDDPSLWPDEKLLFEILIPPEVVLVDDGFTFDTPEDLPSEQLCLLALSWADDAQLEACYDAADQRYYIGDSLLRESLNQHFHTYDFDITACCGYDSDRDALSMMTASGFGGDRSMYIADRRSDGSVVTYTVDFYTEYAPPGVLPDGPAYQRKVYRVDCRDGGWYYLSAQDVTWTLEPGAAANDAPAFCSRDVQFGGQPFFPIQPITAEALDAQFGPPASVTRTPVHDWYWETRDYGGVTATVDTYGDAGHLAALTYRQPDLACLRDVRVGDSLAHVLAAYRNDAAALQVTETEYGPAAVLYGTPGHMQEFGILQYRGGRPYQLQYQEDGVGVIIRLDEAACVSEIEIIGGLLA